MTEIHVFANDCEWWIAESLDDAYALIVDFNYGGCVEDLDRDDYDLEQLSDETMIRISCDEDDEPSYGDGGDTVELTAAEWCERRPRGMLCTTEF